MKWQKIVAAFVFAAMAIALLAGCQPNEPREGEYASIYIAVFDSYFNFDPGLHSDMEYLAIDMDSLVNASEADKRAIAEHFAQKFKIEIKDASFKDLEAQGLVHEGNNLSGLLLTIDKVDVTQTTITIDGVKFKSGVGANGFQSVLQKSENAWVLISTELTVMA